MADLKRDVLIKPRNPRPWMTRYLLLRRVIEEPYKRTADRTFHGVIGGCFAARGDHSSDRYAFTEAMIYVDDDGTFWLPDPDAATNQLDGWRPIEACQVCGTTDLDSIVAERLRWQHRGRCYHTYHPGFFNTVDGDGAKTQQRKQERREALKMCNGDPSRAYAACPVRAQCQEWGLRLHSLQVVIGILGGIDEVERRAMLNAARRP